MTPAALQALDPRLHRGARQLQAPRRLRMADAGILPQQGDQGTVRGIEHRYDQSTRQSAENYSAFRRLVHGALHGFAVFLAGNTGRFLMHSILVIGAGKIGSTIADMLHETGDYAGHRRGFLRRGARSGRQGRRQDGPARLQRRGRPAERPEGSLRRAERRALSPDRPCGEGGAARRASTIST